MKQLLAAVLIGIVGMCTILAPRAYTSNQISTRGPVELSVDKPEADTTLSRAIQRFAGRKVRVYCGSSGYGAALIETGEIWINSTFCNPLKELFFRKYERPWRQGVGLLTLTHEALHIRGIFNEARTECVAFQNVDNVARTWHVAPHWMGAILTEAYWDSIQLRQPGSPYYSPKCRENGPWDQTPYDGRWP